MSHLSEERLLGHYYGEEEDAPEVRRHLEGCPDCRALYGELQRTLNLVDSMPAPARDMDYEAQVWRRIEPLLPAPARRRRSWFGVWQRWAAGLAFAGIMAAAFLASRSHPRRSPSVHSAADPQAGERVLTVAVGDYLERSQMVLTELANASAKGPFDISAQQERAMDLVSENRLYRQTAAGANDAAVASVLDELERVWLDIAHRPSRMSLPELETLRGKLESDGILFKIRVLGSNVRSQEESAIEEHPSGGRRKS
jgi:hypothetical protein